MKSAALLGAILAVAVDAVPTVDELYPYTGPKVPVGDWIDPTVKGNGKGFVRLVEPPAVKSASANPTNNVNVISVSYIPNGINIHYQTPFGLGEAPSVVWGLSASELSNTATGKSVTYGRTPPCSFAVTTQCSEFFHDVQIANLKAGTTYYYQIPAANGTTASDVLSFKTAQEAGDSSEFTIAVVNDMGYTNAGGTYKYLNEAVSDGAAFIWHGGDISYADDWYSGILPCESDWPVCYNGTSTQLPGGGDVPKEYDTPLPKGEVANQGGPQGGDMSVLYESNWDLWQQWMNSVTLKAPYMVLPGNHDASCAEFDGPGNVLTAYLNKGQPNGTAAKSSLTYYSCPPSQRYVSRNFTAFQNRFRMPGAETGGVGNFWYSFDYGLAHFVSIDGETDYADSPEWPFARDIKGSQAHPFANQTFVTDSGPFGTVDGDYNDNKAYEQYKWLKKDLESVDRCKTPWVIAMSHRPFYSSEVSSYQKSIRAAFEDLMLQNGVDLYISGHVHWYERLLPLGSNGTIDQASIINNNTYWTNPGVSMAHIINGAAGNVESHSTLGTSPLQSFTTYLDQQNFGFGGLTVHNATALSWSYIHGSDGTTGDKLTLLKRKSFNGTCDSSGGSSSSTRVATATAYPATETAPGFPARWNTTVATGGAPSTPATGVAAAPTVPVGSSASRALVLPSLAGVAMALLSFL
ncbi:acid phosphatase [Trichoderma citrinoviride]|uniref:Purple acid phosphatase n=1 Tax=Trichoderma citrinoviride TaxID=58853 RepID=A0A2T4B081_9HYPO|nr:acid phosphatase [Trichoderma citrinoviride]PTB62729.1 acid phosphatase [Trichoderma citrinoviride]